MTWKRKMFAECFPKNLNRHLRGLIHPKIYQTKNITAQDRSKSDKTNETLYLNTTEMNRIISINKN